MHRPSDDASGRIVTHHFEIANFFAATKAPEPARFSRNVRNAGFFKESQSKNIQRLSQGTRIERRGQVTIIGIVPENPSETSTSRLDCLFSVLGVTSSENSREFSCDELCPQLAPSACDPKLCRSMSTDVTIAYRSLIGSRSANPKHPRFWVFRNEACVTVLRNQRQAPARAPPIASGRVCEGECFWSATVAWSRLSAAVDSKFISTSAVNFKRLVMMSW